MHPFFILFATLTATDNVPAADQAKDIAIGEGYAKEVEKQYKKTKDPLLQARVDKIGAILAKTANTDTSAKVLWGDPRHSNFPYRFTVIQDKDVNAFSLPGGPIYVYEGLLKYVETDDELAGVLAHEIAHGAFRHVVSLQKENNKLEAITLPLVLLTLLTGNAAGAIGMFQFGNLVGTALGNGWSQKAESAADYGGFQFLRSSPYNPGGMITFLERLARDERNQPKIDLGIYRTHPPSRQRVDDLMAYMGKLGVRLERSKVTTSFRTTSSKVDSGFELKFGKRPLTTLKGATAEVRANDAVAKLNALFDADPDLYEVRSEGSGDITYMGKTVLQITAEDAPGGDIKKAEDECLKQIKAGLLSIRLFTFEDN